MSGWVNSFFVFNENYQKIPCRNLKLIYMLHMRQIGMQFSFALTFYGLLTHCYCIFFSNYLFVASINHVWRLASTPIRTQITQVLQTKEFELALHLAVSI